MFRKFSFSLLSMAIAVGIFAIGSIAQTAPLSGKVELKKADGSVVPLEGATVEVFRTDIKASGPSDKTDKKGQFSFAGLQLGAVFVLSVSAPGASPTYLPGIKPGTDNLKLTLNEGDGRRLTPDEVRTAAAQGSNSGGTTGELTEEQKKAQAEYLKQKAEVESKNAKIQQETVIIEASLKDGNAAYTEKNWDLAIAKYNEGINANPTFAGSAPVLMNNKGAALRERAVNTYNQNVKSTDVSAKVAALGKVKADLGEAADMYYKAWNLLKNAQPDDIKDPKIKESQTATSLRGASDTFRLMALTEQVDETKIELAKTAIPEYIAIETDAAKKEQAKMILGDLYRVTGDAANAIAEYRKVLETAPENLDAMAGLGLSLVNAGYINNDKTQLQEGANVLGKYAGAAPDGHKYKSDAVGLIESLKTEQKIAPQKVAPAKRKN
jgi:tetratricopeptide (TPR) repeat protein